MLEIFNFFKDKDYKPFNLDLEFQEENTGENCVLIACRNGDYPMIKFLNELVKADFSVKNKNGENAIIVCLAANRKNPRQVYFECLIYLVEIAKVDLKSQYEESLLLAQDREIVFYIERQLKLMGITADKEKVEASNRIKQFASPRSDLSIQLDDVSNFNLGDYIGEEDNTSIISNIPNGESQLEPFMSMLGNNNSILKLR